MAVEAKPNTTGTEEVGANDDLGAVEWPTGSGGHHAAISALWPMRVNGHA